MMNKNLTGLIVSLICLASIACGQVGAGTEQERIQRAKDNYLAGEIRAAIIELKSVLADHSQSVEARLALGEIYIDLGDGNSATKELSRAEQLGIASERLMLAKMRTAILQREYQAVLDTPLPDGKQGDAGKAAMLALRAEAMLRLKQPDEAKAELDRAIAVDAKLLRVWVVMARWGMEVGDAAVVRKALETAAAIDPQDHERLNLSGMFAFAQADYPAAEKAFRQVIADGQGNFFTSLEFEARVQLSKVLMIQKDYEGALEVINQLVESLPNNPLPVYLRALAYFQFGDFVAAEENLLQVIGKAPRHQPSILMLGAVNSALGRYEKANMYLTTFVANDPSSLWARKLLAATRLKLDQAGAAVEALEPILADAKDDHGIKALFGMASVRAGNTEEGRRYLEQALVDSESQWIREELAKTYISEGDVDSAVRELKILVQSSGSNQQAKILLIQSYLLQKNYTEALKVADGLDKENPNSPSINTLFASIYMTQGVLDRAQQYLFKALEIEPGYVPALLNMARFHHRAKDYKQAITYYESVLKADPNHQSALMLLARAYEDTGNSGRAIEYVERAAKADSATAAPHLLLGGYYLRVGKPEKARDHALIVLAGDSNNIAALNIKAEADLSADRPKQALETYTRLAELRPDLPAIQVRLGIVQARVGLESSAEDSFSTAIGIDPDYFPAVAAYAREASRAGQTSKALSVAKDFQSRHPNAPAGYVVEADVYMVARQFDKAAQAYAVAYSHYPTSMLAGKHYSAQSKADGKYYSDESSRLLRAWLTDHPEDVSARVVLASALQGGGENAQAINEFETVLKYDSDNLMALNNLAWFYNLAGNPEALVIAQRAADLKPTDPAMLDTIGWVFVEQGQLEKGLAILQQASAAAPAEPEISYHLAVALMKAGKGLAAKDILVKVLASDKAFSDLTQAQDLFDTLK